MIKLGLFLTITVTFPVVFFFILIKKSRGKPKDTDPIKRKEEKGQKHN